MRIDVSEELIKEAGKILHTKSKRETITMALKDVLRKKAIQEIESLSGKVTFDMTAGEIRKKSERPVV